MNDKLAKPNGAAINDHATIADLKAKKERQQARTDDASPAAPPFPNPAMQAPEQKHSITEADKPKQARPDRAGKKLIAGYFPPETQKALKHISVDEGLTLQQIMADAFALYLATKSKLPKQ